MQLATGAFISIDMLVNPFVADSILLLAPQTARDLFGAPLLPDQSVNGAPSLLADLGRGFGAAARDGKKMSLEGPISATSGLIAPQFTADGGLMHSDDEGDVRLCV